MKERNQEEDKDEEDKIQKRRRNKLQDKLFSGHSNRKA